MAVVRGRMLVEHLCICGVIKTFSISPLAYGSGSHVVGCDFLLTTFAMSTGTMARCIQKNIKWQAASFI